MDVKFFKCMHCGNVVVKVFDQGVPVVCCGENMVELHANDTDGAREKHVPQVTVDGATVTVKATLVCRADLDDDTAYTIVKTIMESKDDIAALHEKGNSIDLTFATEGIAVPFAAGAAKYFAENGITVETAG